MDARRDDDVRDDFPRPTVLRAPVATCPRCDYALQGLPPSGACPECGRRYDLEIVVLRGRTPADAVGGGLSPRVAFLVGSVVVVAWAALFWAVARASRQFPLVFGLTGSVVVLAVLRDLRGRGSARAPRAVEVRLNGLGCRQAGVAADDPACDGVGWGDVEHVGLAPLGDDVGRARLRVDAGAASRDGRRVVVDAELGATPGDLAELRRRIDRWRAAAADADADADAEARPTG